VQQDEFVNTPRRSMRESGDYFEYPNDPSPPDTTGYDERSEIYSQAAQRENEARSRRNRPTTGGSRRPKPNFSDRDDWVSKEVSNWFEEDQGGYSDESSTTQNEDLNWRQSRRGRSRSILSGVKNAVDDILGDFDNQAEAYDRSMGQYLRRVDNSGSDVVDPVRSEESASQSREQRSKWQKAALRTKQVLDQTKKRRVLSQEERSFAMERVPPVGIKAWGPTGDLGIDARTKAILDAREELREAERVLELMKEKTARAREEVVILRTDEELAKKRLKLEDPRRAREQLRELTREIDAASRTFQIARSYESNAQDLLERIEDRHWGLLNIMREEEAQPPNMD